MREPLRNVYINAEGLIFRRGRIYREAFAHDLYWAEYRRPTAYARFLLKNYWLRRGRRDVSTGVWICDNLSASNYHHWLIDCLPRLLRAEELFPGNGLLLLPSGFRRNPYVEFTLCAFPGIKHIRWMSGRVKTRVARLAVVPRPPAFVYRRRELEEVAHRVAAVAGPSGSSRRVYFSRADARRRRAWNETALVRLLRSYDFEIIRIDPAKPWEQVRAARGARVILGVHGAALSNLIFMQAGGRLIELRHGREDVFLDSYRPLAEAMGVDYRMQVCMPTRDSGVPDPRAPEVESLLQPIPFGAPPDVARLRPSGDPLYELNDEDLLVDLDRLRTTLNEALGT